MAKAGRVAGVCVLEFVLLKRVTTTQQNVEHIFFPFPCIAAKLKINETPAEEKL